MMKSAFQLCAILALAVLALQAQDAAGPHPDAPAEVTQFAFLAGSWEAVYSYLPPEGEEQRYLVNWTIGWILDGRALRDDWTFGTMDGTVLGHGTMYRSWDAEKGIWRFAEMTSSSPELHLMWGEQQGDTMVMYETTEFPGYGEVQARRIFSGITENSFYWQLDISTDGGTTWIPDVANMKARRK